MPPAYLTKHVCCGFQNNRGKLGRGQQERQPSMLVRALQTAVFGTMHAHCGGNNSVLLPQPTSICIPLSLFLLLSFFLSTLAIKTNTLELKCSVLFLLVVFIYFFFSELALMDSRPFTHCCTFSLCLA